jgi:hypothetical protein
MDDISPVIEVSTITRDKKKEKEGNNENCCRENDRRYHRGSFGFIKKYKNGKNQEEGMRDQMDSLPRIIVPLKQYAE